MAQATGTAKKSVVIKHRIRPPKRARTPFAFFVKDNFETIARQLNTRSPLPVMTVLGRKWKKAREYYRHTQGSKLSWESVKEGASYTQAEKLKNKYRMCNAKDKERFRVSQELWKKIYKGQPPKIADRNDLKKSRRARNAYQLFERDAWKSVHMEHPDWDEHMIIKELAHRWYGLANEQRQYYLQLAVFDVKTYKMKMREYRLFKSRRALCVHMNQGRALAARNREQEEIQRQGRPEFFERGGIFVGAKEMEPVPVEQDAIPNAENESLV